MVDFFARTTHFVNISSSLHIIINWAYKKEITEHLAREGYSRTCGKQDPDIHLDKLHVLHPHVDLYQRSYPGQSDPRNIIRLIFITYTHPIWELLGLKSHHISTAMLCFASWNKAYPLFPRSTFINKESYLPRLMGD